MIPALLLIASAILFRILVGFFGPIDAVGWMNFTPLAAIALCGAAYFPTRYKLTVPMVSLLVSDVALNVFHYHVSIASPFIISHYVGFALIGLLGWSLQSRASFKTLLPASIAASLIFYFVTNCVSWVYETGYSKTFAGFVQAQTIGLPVYNGATPSWMFLRNSLLGDLFFTSLFVACMSLGTKTSRARAEARLPRVV
jgi:hypothetical protein